MYLEQKEKNSWKSNRHYMEFVAQVWSIGILAVLSLGSQMCFVTHFLRCYFFYWHLIVVSIEILNMAETVSLKQLIVWHSIGSLEVLSFIHFVKRYCSPPWIISLPSISNVWYLNVSHWLPQRFLSLKVFGLLFPFLLLGECRLNMVVVHAGVLIEGCPL